jgi:phage-related protein
MLKQIVIDYRAEKELDKFSEDVYYKFEGLTNILRNTGKINFPDGKKIGKRLFELRAKIKGEYRGLYAYIKDNQIIILHFFRKKTQKTPIKDIKVSEKRLKDYE